MRREPMILPAPRWTVLLIGAGLLLSVIGFNSSTFLPGPPTVVVAAASDATLVRDRIASALTAGTILQVGDEVRIGAEGRATIGIGESEARLAGGAGLRIDIVSADVVILRQLSGRIFHRVAAAADTTYTVEIGSLDWTAHGTAFDLDRSPSADGETVTMVAVQHAVQLSGPSLLAVIAEGRLAVITLGGGEPEMTTREALPVDLHDPWLVENARIDIALGNPVGVLKTLEAYEYSVP
jgi:hypothetical protein